MESRFIVDPCSKLLSVKEITNCVHAAAFVNGVSVSSRLFGREKRWISSSPFFLAALQSFPVSVSGGSLHPLTCFIIQRHLDRVRAGVRLLQP